MCSVAYTAPGALKTKFEADTGETADATFGAYVLTTIGANLFVGLGNEPAGSDGAEIVSTPDGVTLTTERVLDEQGILDMHALAGELWSPSCDPIYSPFGSVYKRDAVGVWSQQETIPTTWHVWGLCHDSGGNLFACTGSYSGGGAVFEGRVLRSPDGGATWPQNVQVNDYRVFDVIEFGARLYAIGYHWTGSAYQQQLWYSVDGGATWNLVAGQTPHRYQRFVQFGTLLIYIDELLNSLRAIDAAFAITSYSLPASIASLRFNVLTTDGTYLYVLDASGYIWRSSDLVDWTRYSFVAGGIALTYWASDSSLIVSDIGTNARLWRVVV